MPKDKLSLKKQIQSAKDSIAFRKKRLKQIADHTNDLKKKGIKKNLVGLGKNVWDARRQKKFIKNHLKTLDKLKSQLLRIRVKRVAFAGAVGAVGLRGYNKSKQDEKRMERMD